MCAAHLSHVLRSVRQLCQFTHLFQVVRTEGGAKAGRGVGPGAALVIHHEHEYLRMQTGMSFRAQPE